MHCSSGRCEERQWVCNVSAGHTAARWAGEMSIVREWRMVFSVYTLHLAPQQPQVRGWAVENIFTVALLSIMQGRGQTPPQPPPPPPPPPVFPW